MEAGLCALERRDLSTGQHRLRVYDDEVEWSEAAEGPGAIRPRDIVVLEGDAGRLGCLVSGPVAAGVWGATACDAVGNVEAGDHFVFTDAQVQHRACAHQRQDALCRLVANVGERLAAHGDA